MSCVHEFSLRMHTLVSNHASPASKLCSQDMRIACSAHACAAGLRPHLILATGRPPCGSVSAAGRRLYIARPPAV